MRAQHFLDALCEATGRPREELAERLHARVMGSFARGQADCGDIDFILAPSPAGEHARVLAMAMDAHA